MLTREYVAPGGDGIVLNVLDIASRRTEFALRGENIPPRDSRVVLAGEHTAPDGLATYAQEGILHPEEPKLCGQERIVCPKESELR